MLNYKQIWYGINLIRWLNKFNLTVWLLCKMFHSSSYPTKAMTHDSSHESTNSFHEAEVSFHYPIQTWKWLLHVESSLSLFLSHLNINEKYNLSSQPPTLSIKWLVPCKKNWSNSSLLSYFIFIAFSLYLYCM